ncbi:signal peptidase I [Candidatus Saccharibacteria bacterium]|nr:MAG: signal peptidase I [Candidatus Saccharibacteria bacterium]
MQPDRQPASRPLSRQRSIDGFIRPVSRSAQLPRSQASIPTLRPQPQSPTTPAPTRGISRQPLPASPASQAALGTTQQPPVPQHHQLPTPPPHIASSVQPTTSNRPVPVLPRSVLPPQQLPHQMPTQPEQLQQPPATRDFTPPPPQEAPRGHSGLRTIWKFPAYLSGFAALIWGGAALLNAFVFQSYFVDGLSMQPTLQDDDRILVSKIGKTSAEVIHADYMPERGDIVVLDSGTSEFTSLQNEQIIKRVIGVPGDIVVIENGTVQIKNREHPDGFNVDEQLELDVAPTHNEGPSIVQVPDGHLFVLGDNRAEGGSYDSRSFGTVSNTHVQGKLLVRVLPLKQVRVF